MKVQAKGIIAAPVVVLFCMHRFLLNRYVCQLLSCLCQLYLQSVRPLSADPATACASRSQISEILVALTLCLSCLRANKWAIYDATLGHFNYHDFESCYMSWMI